MSNQFTGEQAIAVLNQLNSSFAAAIQAAQMNTSQEVQTLEIDLSIARDRNNPLKVSFPFKSLYVEDATDVNCSIKLLPNSLDQGMGDVRLQLKDSFSHEFGIRNCFIYWTAQSGKKMILKFFPQAKVVSGQLILNDSSIAREFTVGNTTVQDDGLSFIIEKQYSFGTANSVTSLAPSAEIKAFSLMGLLNPKSFMNGIGGAETDAFRVPAGYQLQLLGTEMDVTQAWSTGTSFSVFAAWAENNAGAFPALFSQFYGTVTPNDTSVFATVGAKKCIPFHYQATLSNAKVSRSFTWDEGQIPVLQTSKGGAPAAGGMLLRMLFRLVKKVGA